MLVLTRRIGEMLIISNEIEVIVLSAQRNQVRLGINAPKEIDVHRKEVFQKIQLSRKEHPELVPSIEDIIARRYKIDEELFRRALRGDRDSEYQVGKLLYDREDYFSARDFLELASLKGHLEASQLVANIQQKQSKAENENGDKE